MMWENLLAVSCFPVPGFNGPLYIPQDDYDYHPYHCAHNGLQPHPRIRELAEEVRALFSHYMENETKSVAPPTFCFLFFFLFAGGRKTCTGTDRRRKKV